MNRSLTQSHRLSWDAPWPRFLQRVFCGKMGRAIKGKVIEPSGLYRWLFMGKIIKFRYGLEMMGNTKRNDVKWRFCSLGKISVTSKDMILPKVVTWFPFFEDFENLVSPTTKFKLFKLCFKAKKQEIVNEIIFIG